MTSKTIAIAGVLAAAVSHAENKSQAPPAVEPSAISALERMGEFLRRQQSFTVRVDISHDYVVDSGQKVRLSSHGDLRVRRPDRLRADIVSDRKTRELFYAGNTFTIYSPRVGYYATVAAPPTINQLADQLEDRYGLELPIVDLFRLGTNKAVLQQITSARWVGLATIDGVATDQYAFRQSGLDWQIWIQRGDRPLPRKLVLTTTDDPARPERSIEMTWDLGAKHPESTFTFVPPKDSRRIAIAGQGGASIVARKQEMRPTCESRNTPSC
jgi:hypothetical protein